MFNIFKKKNKNTEEVKLDDELLSEEVSSFSDNSSHFDTEETMEPSVKNKTNVKSNTTKNIIGIVMLVQFSVAVAFYFYADKIGLDLINDTGKVFEKYSKEKDKFGVLVGLSQPSKNTNNMNMAKIQLPMQPPMQQQVPPPQVQPQPPIPVGEVPVNNMPQNMQLPTDTSANVNKKEKIKQEVEKGVNKDANVNKDEKLKSMVNKMSDELQHEKPKKSTKHVNDSVKVENTQAVKKVVVKPVPVKVEEKIVITEKPANINLEEETIKKELQTIMNSSDIIGNVATGYLILNKENVYGEGEKILKYTIKSIDKGNGVVIFEYNNKVIKVTK